MYDSGQTSSAPAATIVQRALELLRKSRRDFDAAGDDARAVLDGADKVPTAAPVAPLLATAARTLDHESLDRADVAEARRVLRRARDVLKQRRRHLVLR